MIIMQAKTKASKKNSVELANHIFIDAVESDTATFEKYMKIKCYEIQGKRFL